MDSFFERLMVRAATIDELLSNDFEELPGQKGDSDLAARRLAAWCRAAASGDWSLFARRLARDRLQLAEVLPRMATVRRCGAAPVPAWVNDALWIDAALREPTKGARDNGRSDRSEPRAFDSVFRGVIDQAENRLWSSVEERVSANLNESARATLRHGLMTALSNLCAPALYERFAKARNGVVESYPTKRQRKDSGASYESFTAYLQMGGFRELFEEKPVLLRLLAVISRQWINTTREFLLRLDADLDAIRRDIVHSSTFSPVVAIQGDQSDPHNGGNSVQIVHFEDGARVVYKPKDLRVDAAWYALVGWLNESGAPLELKAARVITRAGYGWVEFINHSACAGIDGMSLFFRRSGAWLVLFHLFSGSDMHHENIIASGDHPVPIDLEMILQAAAEENKSHDAEAEAFEAAGETVANSVMAVGLLPTYGKTVDGKIFTVGGLAPAWTPTANLVWIDINSDMMRPVKEEQAGKTIQNLPHADGLYAKFVDHLDEFIEGFESYGSFLICLARGQAQSRLIENFVGLPVRKVIRPTRFYDLMMRRLKDPRTMDDGVVWSVQADFLARLSNWDGDVDVLWPLQRIEREALLELNVPHFVSPSDGNEITDVTGVAVRAGEISGVARARARVKSFNERDLAWQIAVIGQNTIAMTRLGGSMTRGHRKLAHTTVTATPTKEIFISEAEHIADELGRHAVRRGPGAAWIGLDWLGDSEVAQLVTLGPDLYNGVSGIAIFLAAHARVTGETTSGELALAAIANLRRNLKGRNAARIARSLGTGGVTGLGSIVYTFVTIANLLHNDGLLADAYSAAALFTDDLIAADKALDFLGGSAGAILALLRLYRDSESAEALDRAIKCGEHLLAQPRILLGVHRSWGPQGAGETPLNGISHGAAGFAYALTCLAATTERDDFARAAAECIALEDSRFDSGQNNWPTSGGGGEPSFHCQWCHGAPGIGLARIAMGRRGILNSDLHKLLSTDIRNALSGVERGWPNGVDTMCCGTLGSIEFLSEAARALGRDDLRELAGRRMLAVVESAAATGDYRFDIGCRQFNLGLFRGLAGVGYTCLRLADASLPNILTLE